MSRSSTPSATEFYQRGIEALRNELSSAHLRALLEGARAHQLGVSVDARQVEKAVQLAQSSLVRFFSFLRLRLI